MRIVNWRVAEGLYVPLAIFGGTRAVLALAVWAGQVLIPLNSAAGAWLAFPRQLFLDGWVRWDAGYYLLAAERGYQWDAARPHLTPLVLPLFPLLIRLGSAVTNNAPAVALVIANASFAAAAVLLYRLAAERFGRGAALRATLFVCLFPYSFVLGAAQADALALLLAVACFYLIEKRKLAGASAAVALAVLSSPAGLALWLALLVAWAERWHRKKGAARLALLLPPLALGGLVAHLLGGVGEPVDAIKATVLGSTPYGLLSGGLAGLQNLPGVAAAWTLAPAIALAVISLIVAPFAARLLGLPYAVFLCAAVLLPVVVGFDRLGPALAVAFPLVVVLANYSRREVVENALAVTFTIFLGGFALLYAGWYPADRVATPITPARVEVGSIIPGAAPRSSAKSETLNVEVRNALMILGYTPPARTRPGQSLGLSFDVQTLRPTTRTYSVVVHVADQTGRTLASAGHTPGGSDWKLGRSAGEVVGINIAVPLPASMPTGVYDLELLVFDATTWATQPLISAATGRVQRVFLDKTAILRQVDVSDGEARPTNPTSATLADRFSLSGFDLSPVSPSVEGLGAAPAGQQLTVTLYWRSLARADIDYTVFVQALDDEGKLVAQSDSFPVNGRYPTSSWAPGETVRDAHRLAIPQGASGKHLRIIAGMYRLATMERLRVFDGPGRQTNDHVALGSIQIGWR